MKSMGVGIFTFMNCCFFCMVKMQVNSTGHTDHMGVTIHHHAFQYPIIALKPTVFRGILPGSLTVRP